MVTEIDVLTFETLRQNEPLFVLDVREDWELEICRIDGSHHIPMTDVPSRLAELPKDSKIVVLCHHGVRSEQVAFFLSMRGFGDLLNLSGGIDSYAAVVDHSLARY